MLTYPENEFSAFYAEIQPFVKGIIVIGHINHIRILTDLS